MEKFLFFLKPFPEPSDYEVFVLSCLLKRRSNVDLAFSSLENLGFRNSPSAGRGCEGRNEHGTRVLVLWGLYEDTRGPSRALDAFHSTSHVLGADFISQSPGDRGGNGSRDRP